MRTLQQIQRAEGCGFARAVRIQNNEALSRTAGSAGWIACHVECTIGDLGHCGRTQHEHFHHCEKLFNEKKPQRGEKQSNVTDDLQEKETE